MADVKAPAPPASSRRSQAQQTRVRMIRAAHQLFVERGYSGTRMADVAAVAGVAVQTVYFRFHTKAELLQACYELAVVGEGAPLPPPLQPWYRAVMTADSGPVAMRHFAEGNTSIVARVGLLDDVVRSALHEPDAVAVRAHNEQLRRDGYRDIVVHLDDRFGLRPPLTIGTATDLLLLVGSAAPYRSLVVECGWTLPAFVDWLATALVELLLASPR
jgi:AcrR family transcriptional regulator